MKKFLSLILVIIIALSLAACGEKVSDAPPATEEVESTHTPAATEPSATKEVKAEKQSDDTGPKEPGDELSELVEADIEDTFNASTAEYEQLKVDLDTYDKYIENIDKMEAFYNNVNKTHLDLCIRMREYSTDYAEKILSSDIPNDEKRDELDELYDSIYDDGGDDIYDDFYDGILDDIYDDFYDGVLDDGYEEAPYDEWSDARSQEYEWWSDTRSEVYDQWSDFRSEVYEFWSDLKSELWDNDIEKAYEVINDFKEDINELKGENSLSDESGNGGETASVEGLRPEFKEAMDNYEAFCDEYCELMKKYKEDPTDTTLITEYADMVSKFANLEEEIDAWEDEDLSGEELKYYIEVSGRVSQKLVDAAS